MTYRFDRFELHDEQFRLLADGVPISLEPKALRLLVYLVAHRGRVVRKQELLDKVWGETNVSENALTRSIGLLRRTLQDDTRVPRFIETVPTVGYRFVAEVMEGEASSAGASTFVLPPAEKTEPARGERRMGWKTGVVFAVAVLIIAVAGWLVKRNVATRNEGEGVIRSLAVLPLENLSGDPGQDYFADGMTDQLITELARIPGLRVVSRTSVMQDKGTHKTLKQIAGELGVDAVVEGSIVRVGDKVRITAQLIDARTDRHLWAESFEGRGKDVLSLQDSVAMEIATRAKVALLHGAGTTEERPRAVDPVAHDAYLRGLYFYNKRDIVQSAVYFQKAVDTDPKYASGYTGLANAYESEYTLDLADRHVAIPKGIELCKKAISLDPTDGEAYTALGSLQTLDWDWTAAEPNLKRGLELSPSSSLGEMKYAIYLDVTGHPEDAIFHMRRALQLDPLSFFMNRHMGSTLYFGRHYDEALEYLQRAKEMEPGLQGVVDNWMSFVYEKKGMQKEAVEHDLAALRGHFAETDVSALSEVYRNRGWKPYWAARLDVLATRPQGCLSYDRGVNAMRQGNRDVAFEQLTKSVDDHCFWTILTQIDPILDDLRGDDRFDTLLRRMELRKP